MQTFIVYITLFFLCWTQTLAIAGPHEEGIAAGNAANPVIRDMVNQPGASAVVPGYTTTPPERAYYGQPDLAGHANARLAECALAPADPVCEAQRGAIASANTPRQAVTASDANVVSAKAIARAPSTELGSLAAFYAGCATPGNCPSNVFCLGNSCFNTAYTNDTDFARAMSYMEAAREAGVYLDTNTMQVFKGEANSCRDRLLKNCCYADNAGAGMTNQSMFGVGSRLVYDVLMNADNREFIYQGMQALLTSGGFSGSFTSYGVTVAVNGTALPAGSVTLATTDSLAIAFDPWSLAIAVVIYIVMSMTSCNEGEGKLAMKEGAHLCHTTGQWCSSCIRVFGRCVSCIEHTTSKCCFNSVLSRIVNEQGRRQVGKGWGGAEHPDCSGFTIAQLQALDFAAMDLTEFYASIVPSMPNLGNIQLVNAARIARLSSNPAPALIRMPLPTPAPVPVPMPGPTPMPSGPLVTAASCSFTAVKSAVDSATAGTTVKIPAGDCNWGTQQLNVPGGIYLLGSGKDVTTIRRGSTVPETSRLVSFDCSNGKRATFSDMTLVGPGRTIDWESGLGLYKCVDFRVFNSKFTGWTFSAVFVDGLNNQRGVIYKNDFINNYSELIRNIGYGVKIDGDDTYGPLEVGTQNAVFVEDNYFYGNRHNIASLAGSKYVFRYNTAVATDLVKDFAMTDAHGMASGRRGSRSWEIYNNAYSTSLSSGTERTAIGMRGGDGVIFNNTITGNVGRPIELEIEGSGCGSYPVTDQIRSAYFWNNTKTGAYADADGIANTCPSSIQKGRDYFTTAKPGYTPYTYPHPLRAMP